MTQVITRLYANKTDADAAVKDLKTQRHGDNEIFVIASPKNGKPSIEKLTDAITKASIIESEAAIYAAGVIKGSTLVVLHAAFGSAGKAAALLDDHNPIASGVDTPTQIVNCQCDKAAPLSSLLQWPTLLKDPTPFATFFNFPSLIHHDTIFSSQPHALLSLNNPTPLSDLLEHAVLLDSPTPLSDKFEWPLLSDDPTPASNHFGWNVLK